MSDQSYEGGAFDNTSEILAALAREREGYVLAKDTARVSQVDAEIARLSGTATTPDAK